MNKSKFVQKTMIIVNKLVKKKKRILFNSYPAYSDNSWTLFEYIVNNRSDITSQYQIIWGQEKNCLIPEYVKKYRVETVDKKSLKGILTFLSSKYIFSTHGYFPGILSGNGQIQINLWHGCGYKTITDADHVYRGDINVVTSSAYVPIHEKVFDMQEGNVYPTGLPRNDVLFSSNSAMEKLGINQKKYEKRYIWMPTYRMASEGHEGIDGKSDSFTISTMTQGELSNLNNTLCQTNALLIVKPHPMDAKAFDNVTGFSNIITITNEKLMQSGVQLYELLAETDGMLSDYSSVVIDYLILQKPIVMVMSDITEYKNNRGLVFDNMEDYVPGPIITNIEGLRNYFINADIIDDEWSERRIQLSHFFHNNLDNQSCERVCNLIFGKKK